MQWIRNELLKQGAIVVNVELWGHGDNPIVITDSSQVEERLSKFKQVTWTQWMNNTKPAMDLVRKMCQERNLPKYFFGFSLGALVGLSMSNDFDFIFDKYFLLAPAIKIKFWPRVFIGILSPFPNMVIKSKAPIYYRENRGTPIAAYKALLKGAKKFNKVQANLNNCLIIVDKNDEVVSSKKLQQYADDNNDEIVIIQKRKKNCEYCNVNHLIIDEESLGPYSTFVSSEIQSFFE